MTQPSRNRIRVTAAKKIAVMYFLFLDDVDCTLLLAELSLILFDVKLLHQNG